MNPDFSNPENRSNPDESEEDQVARTVELFNKADKVLKAMQTPQSIRELQPFDGNPVKLHSFIRAVENLLPFLNTLRDTPFEQVWLQSIRAKIIGDADQVLEIYGTPLVWEEIKSNLIAYYNDKRDSVTLTRELFQRQQVGSIEDFYSEVQHLLSLLINHTNIMTINPALKADRIKTHQENALQVFLAGLKEPIGGNVRARKPLKLKEAFDACVEERNFQAKHGLGRSEQVIRLPKPAPPLPPPKQTQHHYNRPVVQPQKFYPRPFQQNLSYNSRSFHPSPTFNTGPPQQPPKYNPHPFQQTQNYNPRQFHQQNNTFNPPVPQRNVFAPRQIELPKPTPMEVDRSIRTNKINYMNRPNYHEGIDLDPNFDQHEYEDTHAQYYETDNIEPEPSTSGTVPSEQDNHEIAYESDELNFHLIQTALEKR